MKRTPGSCRKQSLTFCDDTRFPGRGAGWIRCVVGFRSSGCAKLPAARQHFLRSFATNEQIVAWAASGATLKASARYGPLRQKMEVAIAERRHQLVNGGRVHAVQHLADDRRPVAADDAQGAAQDARFGGLGVDLEQIHAAAR